MATLTKEYFSDPEWVFEPKLDGERCLAFKRGKEVKLYSRNKLLLNDGYPEIVGSLARQQHDFIVDGEVIALRNRVASFGALQQRMHVASPSEALVRMAPVYLHLFDVIHLDGYDVTAAPLRERKNLLRKALAFDRTVKFVRHRNTEGQTFLEEACAKGWEGLIAKRASAPYTHGRSKDWLKFKCSIEQEFVIGGFTDPKGQRSGFGALLVGYYQDGDLRFAGKVGTGYGAATLRSLTSALTAIEREDSPFAGRPPIRKGAHWVEPELVAQVGFSEWTTDGKLRHPRFLGLRRDKDARSVIHEGAD